MGPARRGDDPSMNARRGRRHRGVCDNRHTMQPSPLARYLYAAYALLIVYASLHPFTGWRDNCVLPFAFLVAPLPRYVTAFDVIANVLAYAPLGFLGALALFPAARGA